MVVCRTQYGRSTLVTISPCIGFEIYGTDALAITVLRKDVRSHLPFAVILAACRLLRRLDVSVIIAAKTIDGIIFRICGDRLILEYRSC